MGIYTSSDLFFNTTSNSAGLAYNNKYKLELNVNQSIQNMLDKYKSTGIPELNDNYLSLMCKQTSFPAYSMSRDYIYSYGGRKIPVYGDRQYDNMWTATFYTDRRHVIREFFIDWLDKIHNQNKEVRQKYTDYTVNGRIFQAYWMQNPDTPLTAYTNDPNSGSYYKVAGYRMNAMFPIAVGNISVDEQAPITIEEFEVQFAFTDVDVIPKDKLNQPW